MTSTIKCTLFHFTLVIIIHQLMSIQSQKHKRNRRAILHEESNHTLPSQRLTHTLETISVDPNPSTVGFNTTLTSEERLQQLQKLKDAESHLRKNLREKGKEYENQLYENWPKLLDVFNDPAVLNNPAMKHIFNLGMNEDDLKQMWPSLVQELKKEGVTQLENLVKLWQDGSTMAEEAYKNIEEVDPLIQMFKESHPAVLDEVREALSLKPTTPGTTKKMLLF